MAEDIKENLFEDDKTGILNGENEKQTLLVYLFLFILKKTQKLKNRMKMSKIKKCDI